VITKNEGERFGAALAFLNRFVAIDQERDCKR
jgi:hypothetical protein